MGSTTVMGPVRRVVLFRVWIPFVLCALVATACGGDGGSDGSAGSSTQPALNATTAALLPTDAYALPDFDYGTYQKLLGQLKGTPVLVNIWASWCGPCRAEAPHLAAAAKAYGGRVQFLGIDILDSRPSARGFMREFGWTYPSVYDVAGAIRDRMGFIGQPVTLFYDAAGDTAFTWQGPISAEVLTQQLGALTSSGSAA